jgi:hypothetical protein
VIRQLVRELIPHAPQLGLYVTPEIPPDKLRNAIRDYARSVQSEEALALYDSTLMGSAKDGAVFTAERVVFQNNDLESTHDVRYEDIVRVESKRKLLGGRRVLITVNRGRATFDVEMDFSGKPEASEYVASFLREAMLGVEPLTKETSSDVNAVRAALEDLHARGLLSNDKLSAMLEILDRE